jgi:transposase
MESVKEQTGCIKFCVKVRKTAAEAYALKETTIYKWFKRSKNGRTSTDGDEQSGRPSTSRSEILIAQVKNIIHGNRRLTVREVAEEVGISTGSCHTILTEDLRMHRV